MQHPPLTVGCIKDIFENKNLFQPIVQVIDIKKIQSNAQRGVSGGERFRLIISDSLHYQQAMLATQLNHLVNEGSISSRCVLKLNDYTCNTVHNRRIVILLNVEILTQPLQMNIGTPENIEVALGQNVGQPSNAPPSHVPQTTSNIPPSRPMNNQSSTQQYTPQRTQPQQSNSSNHTQAPSHSNNFKPPNQQMKPSQNQYRAPSANSSFQNNNNAQLGGDANFPIYTIKSLNPYQNRWTIKARVTSKSDVKTWTNAKGSGRLFNIDLVDQSGEIRCTLFQDMVDKYFELFRVGQVYLISKGSLKFANKKFSSIQNDYELTLDANSVVQPCNDPVDIPRMHFKFTPIADISKCQKDDIVDIIAIVTETSPGTSITTKSQKETTKRVLKIVDMSSWTIEVTLWGALAENPGWMETDHPVIAIKGARVSDFNGKSLATVNSSHLEINPDLNESHTLREWYDMQGGSISTYSLSVNPRANNSNSDGIQQDFSNRTAERKDFAQIKTENLGRNNNSFFETRGTIVLIKHEGSNIWYNACPKCNKKVTEENGQWKCEKCITLLPNCEKRYILSFLACDHTGSTWLNCFNEVGQAILSISANELDVVKQQSEQQYESFFEAASFKPYIFKIRAKEENYQNEMKVRCSVTQATPVDFVSESRRLIQIIQQNQMVM